MRVVNALLTQIDSIKHLPNVLIFTTSNITGAIDLAFVDRADIKQYVGLPSQSAIYQIYYSCVQVTYKLNDFSSIIEQRLFQELINKKIIQVGDFSLLSLRSLQVRPFIVRITSKVHITILDVSTSRCAASARAPAPAFLWLCGRWPRAALASPAEPSARSPSTPWPCSVK